MVSDVCVLRGLLLYRGHDDTLIVLQKFLRFYLFHTDLQPNRN